MLESAPALRKALEAVEADVGCFAVKHRHANGNGNEPFKQRIDSSRGGALEMPVQVSSGFLIAKFDRSKPISDYDIFYMEQELEQRVCKMETDADSCQQLFDDALEAAQKERAERLKNIRSRFDKGGGAGGAAGGKQPVKRRMNVFW